MSEIVMECGACFCYVENPKTNGQGGDCHRYPPAVVVIRSQLMNASGTSKDHINTVFAPVPKSGAWCLEFRPRPEAQEKK